MTQDLRELARLDDHALRRSVMALTESAASEDEILATAKFALQRPVLLEAVTKLASRFPEHPPLACAIYELVLALPIPSTDRPVARSHWLQAANNGLVLLQLTGRAEDAAALADSVRPYLREWPYLCHSGACAYAAVDRVDDALALCERAAELHYPCLDQLLADQDLERLWQRPEFIALREQHGLKAPPRWAGALSVQTYERLISELRAELDARELALAFSDLERGILLYGDDEWDLAGLAHECSQLELSAWRASIRRYVDERLAVSTRAGRSRPPAQTVAES
jgi:hypothetical protein